MILKTTRSIHRCCFAVFVFLCLVSSGWHDFAKGGGHAATSFPLPDPIFSNESFAEESLAGELVGEYVKAGRGIQIADLGDGNYRVSIYPGGLPVAGWDKSEPQILETDEEDAKDLIEGAERVQRSSPTIGSSVPSGGVVLFDGTEKSLTEHWEPGAKLEGGLLVAGAATRSKFRDYRLHLEFKVPEMPKSLGQARGNSGVYHQGRYETQVLDSFGFENASNTLGAIYGVKKADINAALPPGEWQTYDIEFLAARWDSSGKKTENAKLTVRLNGVVIHSGVQVPGPTTAAPVAESPEDGPLYLQDHGNPVLYRNIWIMPIDAARLSMRPRVAGYERLLSLAEADASRSDHYDVMGGQILINELGCVKCHASNVSEYAEHVKIAPNLSNVGSRLHRGYIAKFLNNPHELKPGTTMPDVLVGLEMNERANIITALSAYLESTGANQRAPRLGRNSVRRGEQLYKEIGCAVCHAMPDGAGATATTVLLPDISEKYSTSGLVIFLKDPHAVRPSDRMPSLHLSDEEARDIASYLVSSKTEESFLPNYRFEVFSGSWDKLPDFSTLTSKSEGTSIGLDLSVARERNNYAIRFRSFFALETKGMYRFHLGSDDGSKLYVNDKLVADCNGIHPHQFASGEVELPAGVHELRVEYFQGGGEASLDLEWESAELPRQSIDPWLALDEVTALSLTKKESIDSELIKKGKDLFQSTGCANCHSMTAGQTVTSGSPSIELARVNHNAGCLSDEPGRSPQFYLSDRQLGSLRKALSSPKSFDQPESKLQWRMAQLNCIACHERNGFGGPEAHSLGLFTTTIPEMGDEGRVPPRLTGVGDKLRDEFLLEVLKQGVRHRPYMKVRMPNYHGAAEDMAPWFVNEDRFSKEESAKLPQEETDIRGLAAGRRLAGTKGLSCAQCHTFGNVAATGIQAIDMQLMTKRVRSEWFYRYLMNPIAYRPGTRMPNSFPEGQSVYKQIYDGNAEHQIAALWLYLSQGGDAALPDGLQRDQIVLEPSERPIIYRNFLDGLSARGIAVGYPGGVNIAWDAETMALRTIWQGAFIDASMHWRDRGVGRQKPLGDLVIEFDRGPAVGLLQNRAAKWPDATQIQSEYRFLGYKLSKHGVPTFRYKIGNVIVHDTILVADAASQKGFKRVLTIEPVDESTPVQSLAKENQKLAVIRLVHGKTISLESPGQWLVDGQVRVQLVSPASYDVLQHEVQSSGDASAELRASLEGQPLPFTVEYTVHW